MITRRLRLQLTRHVRRYTTKPKPDDENSALAERFTAILENKLATSLTRLLTDDPHLKTVYDKYKTDTREITRAKAYIKSEPRLATNRHAKDIYESTPWTGTETTVDANLRMLVELKPKLKNSANRIFTPPVSFRDKIVNAKEGSLDYQLKKDEQKSEQDEFREMYKEKLLGPSMLFSSSSLTSVDFVNTLASSKINEYVNQRGQFDDPGMLHVRGKPLDPEHLKNCTDTNYFMNQVLNNQEVLPPWIETQQNVDRTLVQLRKDLDDLWFKWIINTSPDAYNFTPTTPLSSLQTLYDLKIRFYNADALELPDRAYIEERINIINKSIRSYNLQCPTSNIHKFKLVPAAEIKESFTRTIQQFPQTLQQWHERITTKNTPSVNRTSGGFLNLFGDESKGGGGGSSGDSSSSVASSSDNKLHLWRAIQNAFK